jgi:hypothetical protein
VPRGTRLRFKPFQFVVTGGIPPIPPGESGVQTLAVQAAPVRRARDP